MFAMRSQRRYQLGPGAGPHENRRLRPGETVAMLLRGRDGSELELDVLGYQFPHVEADPWDSNSLLVALRVVSAQGTWEAVDPCLTTWEAARLCRWLALRAGGEAGAVRQSFSGRWVRVSVWWRVPDFSRARPRAGTRCVST